MKTIQILSLIALVLALGCSKDPVAPTEEPAPVPSVGIDVPLLVSASAPVNPSLTNGSQHTFDLSAVSLVQSGNTDDFEVTYTTPNSCDTDVEVFRVTNNTWDRLATATGGTCSPAFTTRSRTLTEQNLKAANYLTTSSQLIIRAGVIPSLRAIDTIDGYEPILVSNRVTAARGVQMRRGVLWIAGQNLHQVNATGTWIGDVTTAIARHYGLAFDGTMFWSVDIEPADDIFFGFTPDGTINCSFVGSSNFPVNGAMVYLNDIMWAARANAAELYKVDLVASCAANSMTITQTVPIPVVATAIATDGTNFYIANDVSIKKINSAGTELENHPLTVDRVIDMTYSGNSLWILHTGPAGVQSRGVFLSKFDL